jgi:ABC-2 type transport system ATP-binding protein
MKRRLDLALALVHRPRVLFLDEPTTGLDPQSRSAVWVEVGRLAKEEGVTVFLTTQYLEEADLLADDLAIIHRGRIVAEGTPAELKETIGRPTVEVVPADPDQRDAVAQVLSLFGTPTTGAPGALAVRVERDSDLAEIVRALDDEDLHGASVQLHAPSLDDVFLAKTGRSLEGGAEDAEEAVAAS